MIEIAGGILLALFIILMAPYLILFALAAICIGVMAWGIYAAYQAGLLLPIGACLLFYIMILAIIEFGKEKGNE